MRCWLPYLFHYPGPVSKPTYHLYLDSNRNFKPITCLKLHCSAKKWKLEFLSYHIPHLIFKLDSEFDHFIPLLLSLLFKLLAYLMFIIKITSCFFYFNLSISVLNIAARKILMLKHESDYGSSLLKKTVNFTSLHSVKAKVFTVAYKCYTIFPLKAC